MKFLIVFLMSLSVTGCFAKPVTETIEAVLEFFGKSASKEADDVTGNLIQIIGTKESLKIASRNFQSGFDENEREIRNLIFRNLDDCNTNNPKILADSERVFTLINSPLWNNQNQKSEMELMKKFHLKCEIDKLEYLGSGRSSDEKRNLAYAKITGSINVSGIFSIEYSNMETFVQKDSSWKYWDSVATKINLKKRHEKWWINKTDKHNHCIETETNPASFVKNSISNCKTDGIWGDSNKLIVNCINLQNEIKNFTFFTEENACQDEYKLGY